MKQLIKDIEKVRDVHRYYKKLGFKKYDQDKHYILPRSQRLDTKNYYRCALYTLVCLIDEGVLNNEVRDCCSSCNWDGVDDSLKYCEYLFGYKENIVDFAKRLGYPEPKRFGAREFVGRCNRVLGDLRKIQKTKEEEKNER